MKQKETATAAATAAAAHQGGANAESQLKSAKRAEAAARHPAAESALFDQLFSESDELLKRQSFFFAAVALPPGTRSPDVIVVNTAVRPLPTPGRQRAASCTAASGGPCACRS